MCNLRFIKLFSINLILFVTINIIFCCKSFSASDVNGSSDSEIKIFGNCKVSLVTLKDNKKFVFLEIPHTPTYFFRIIFDKKNPVGYVEICHNSLNLPNNASESGYANIFIGNNQYNIKRNIVVQGIYMNCYFDMPPNFINLLSKNKQFSIEYGNNPGIPIPIILNGFNEAMKYVKHLQKLI